MENLEKLNIIGYIEGEERICPYCEGSMSYIKNSEFSRKFCTIDINCVLCDRSWTEHYDIANVLKRLKNHDTV